MLHSPHKNSPFPSEHRLKDAPILLVLALITGITAFVGALSYLYSINTEERESAQLLQNYKDKANVLVWALEGSARTMMGSRHNVSPLFISGDLLEEIASQPGIVSLCLVNEHGEILVHSDPEDILGQELIGKHKNLPEQKELSQLAKNEPIGRFTQLATGKTYEVITRFTPSDRHRRRHLDRMHQNPLHQDSMRQSSMHQNRMHQGSRMQEMRNRMDALGPLYMVVAFDAKPYDDHLLEVRHKNSVMSFLVTAVACCLAALFLVLYNSVRSQRLLKDARALASQIVTNLPIGLITTDTKGRITLFNSQSLHLLSLDANAVPSSIMQLPHLNWREIMQCLDASTTSLFEDEIEIPLGETGSRAISLSVAKVVDSDGSDSGYLCILRDLQTMKTLQKQIRLNERLSALGNMAAGVAHEIRNPLSTLKGYATYLSEKLKNNPKAYATGQHMIEEVDRLNRVVTDLLYLAKPEQLALEYVDLTQVAQKALQLASFDATSKKIELKLSTGETPLLVKGDSDKLIQALLNIVLNSIQAISHEKGLITISVQPEHRLKSPSKHSHEHLSDNVSDNISKHVSTQSLRQESARPPKPCQTGAQGNITPSAPEPAIVSESAQSAEAAKCGSSANLNSPDKPNGTDNTKEVSEIGKADEPYALIRIRDNGTGMSEETLANLFTPYFSTKASGAGLGMTITHQIIQLHSGVLSVSSVLDEGSVFSIRLPLVGLQQATASSSMETSQRPNEDNKPII